MSLRKPSAGRLAKVSGRSATNGTGYGVEEQAHYTLFTTILTRLIVASRQKMTQQGKYYKNSISKRRLYEIFLNVGDFNMTPDEYNEQIELICIEEAEGGKICEWYKDVDGKDIVGGLNLRDRNMRLEITDKGFRKIPAVSKRSKEARRQRASSLFDIQNLFSPRKAIADPFRFVGRREQVAQALKALVLDGSIIVVRGERSTGKTSFAKMIEQICTGNTDFLSYYDLTFAPPLALLPVFLDGSTDATGIQEFMDSTQSKISSVPQTEEETSREFTVGVKALGYKQATKTKLRSKPSITSLLEGVRRLSQSKRRPVILLDELDHFENPQALSALSRNLAAEGVTLCILGSEAAISGFLSGDTSVARSVVHIALEPMSRREFGEIFHNANLMAEGILYFDSDAIDLIYGLSSGLPFFGHLFGYLSVSRGLPDHTALEALTSDRSKHGPVVITSYVVESARQSLTEELGVYEHLCHQLSAGIQSGSTLLQVLAQHSTVEIDRLGELTGADLTPPDLEAWRAVNPLARQFVQIHSTSVFLADPVLRQYVKLTRPQVGGRA
jgi:hypothetical protein